MKRFPIQLAAGVMALGFVAAACGDADSDATPATTAAESTAAPATTDAMDDEATAEAGDIIEVAVGSEQFPTLVAAVQAAGLVETLQGEGPFTVFAPTEQAFAAALDALGITAEELLADTETLTAILTYHVVPGKVLAADVIGLDGQSVATVNGAEIAIAVDGGVDQRRHRCHQRHRRRQRRDPRHRHSPAAPRQLTRPIADLAAIASHPRPRWAVLIVIRSRRHNCSPRRTP